MAATASIEFEGKKIRYDATVLKKWSVQRKLASGGAGMFEAMDEILLGKSDDVAESLGDDGEKMGELLLAISEKETSVKN